SLQRLHGEPSPLHRSMTTDTTYTVPVPQHKAGARVDRVLADACPELSRTRIKALIEAGRVRRIVRGAPRPTVDNAAYPVEGGQVFSINVPPVMPATPEPQDIPLDIVYEDDDLIVIEKPAGLVVHPAAGNPDRTLVNALLAHCGGSLSGI